MTAPIGSGATAEVDPDAAEVAGGVEADVAWMRRALGEARVAEACSDVPVGCVIVDGAGRLLGSGHNRREVDQDPTAHAEMIAIREASRALGSWRLIGTTLYVTQEPCPMCAGAIVNARVKRVVYGCDNPKAGSARSLHRLLDDPRLNHRVEVEAGVLAAESGQVLSEFFQRLRAAARGPGRSSP